MIRLASVIETFEADFFAQYRHRITSDMRQALHAMKRCRTASSHFMQMECMQCEHQMLIPHSCGHRHCPHCQHHETQKWIARQQSKLVPARYFLLTYTLPAELRALARAHPKQIYDSLMKCSWETLATFSQNDQQLRGTPGAIAVLHTHTRQLEFHPHVHLVVPAAAINAEDKQWRCKRFKKGASYLFNHRALAKVFRAKMLAAIQAAKLKLPAQYPQQWVVDCKAVGSGEKALVYLGRYLYRGVISEKNIESCENGEVSFRYRDAKTQRNMTRTVPGAQFLWLVLQHVLPKGFRRSRNFGFLHPNRKQLIALLQVLLKYAVTPIASIMPNRPTMCCPCCQHPMAIRRTRIRAPCAQRQSVSSVAASQGVVR